MFLSRFNAFLRLSAVRQTLLLLALFTLISLATWGGTYWLVHHEMIRSVDQRLEGRMQAAVAALEAGQDLPALNPGETSAFVQHDRRDGFRTQDAEGTETEMRYLLRTTPQGRLQLGEDTELQEELRDLLAGGMRTSLAVGLVLTTLAGLWMARRSQARLNTVNAGLAAVARGDLGTRITLEGQDDLSLLAERINGTTERLDHAMTQMRVQSSNIAHDLRTPLARLRAQVETNMTDLLNHDRPVSVENLGAAIEQIDRITATFDALLRLARIESGAGRDAFTTVHLDTLVQDVGETFSPVVEDAGQTLFVQTQEAAAISGDHDMLVQLLANLIQNALRYGADQQTITIRVHGPRVIVTDEGPGIPFSERENVLQPLHQMESTRQGHGVGLGLSLVRAIAELHSATLTLSDGPHGRGLCVALQFPRLTKL